jgi:zinc-binding alcohol dehydrogenase family protein
MQCTSEENMKAVGIPGNRVGNVERSLANIEVAIASPEGQDILVRVEAVSVNPIDIRMLHAKDHLDGQPRILGWDAAGIVLETAPKVSLFKPGDHVFYAGSILRPGTNAEMQLVDERLAGVMPSSLDFVHAAALPLTSLAAWEALFDRMRISSSGADSGKTLLVIGGAGGVGSMAIQLAKVLGGLRVVATASRLESKSWCTALGADLIVDHSFELQPQLHENGIRSVEYILCLSDTDHYFPAMAKIIKPHGQICALVESAAPLPMNDLRGKSVTFSWEGMFTRSIFSTADMIEQHRILNRIAKEIDAGRLRTTVRTVLKGMNASTLRNAHAIVETGRNVGKVVISAQS